MATKDVCALSGKSRPIRCSRSRGWVSTLSNCALIKMLMWQKTYGLGVDRMSVKLHEGRYSITFGRFPINHSVTQIFTPNDFFAPFTGRFHPAIVPSDFPDTAELIARVRSEIEAGLEQDER